MHGSPRAEASGEVSDVMAIQTTVNDRKEKLLAALSINEAELLEDNQRSQLVLLVCEFAGAFALDHTELGYTSVVTHEIDSGDNLPVKQPARPVPFTLRKLRE